MIKKREYIIAVIFLLVGIFVSYLFLKYLNHPPKNTVITKQDVPIKTQEIPECVAYRCPVYYSFTVDKDNFTDESEVIVPTAMTQGAGKLMIIKKGKIIFESPEAMQIQVKPSNGGDGFILEYATDVNSPANVEVRYRFKDGKFIQDAKSIHVQ